MFGPSNSNTQLLIKEYRALTGAGGANKGIPVNLLIADVDKTAYCLQLSCFSAYDLGTAKKLWQLSNSASASLIASPDYLSLKKNWTWKRSVWHNQFSIHSLNWRLSPFSIRHRDPTTHPSIISIVYEKLQSQGL